MDEEDIIDDSVETVEEEVMDVNIDESDSDEESALDMDKDINENIEDINVFNKNYDKLKLENKTSQTLSKYEKTKILSKRCEQLESGCQPLIKDYEKYDNIYDIALDELNQKKIPFIVKRFINNRYEYWKLEDLIY
jgi:DNA-directed RNA polymerase I, II, and III subunit RPABC2